MKQFYIDNRDEIGDTLTIRRLIRELQDHHGECRVAVRTDRHNLLSDMGVEISDRYCVICGHTEHSAIHGTPYFRCTKCDFWYQFPPPPARWEKPSIEGRGHLMSERDQQVNDAIAASLVEKCNPKSALDVGSKYPYLSYCLKQRGVEVVQGIDGCESALDYGKQLDIPMIQANFLTHDFERTYDLITMIHLIEHFVNPRDAIRAAKRVLVKGGQLFIRTPITDGPRHDDTRDLTQEHYMIHPVLPGLKSLNLLLDQEGFEVDDTVLLRGVGQVDIRATFVEDRKTNPVFHQWTHKNEYGDYFRRKHHFYDYPIVLAQEIGWLPKRPLPPAEKIDLPPFPAYEIDEPFVAIVHEVGGVSRRWPMGRWKRLIEWLKSEGYNVAVVGKDPLGSEEARDLTGTTVLESMGIIQKAALCVCADTVAAHIASSVGTPCVVLMGPTDPEKVFLSDTVHLVYRADGGCINCHFALRDDQPYREGEQLPIHTCDPHNSDCMHKITVGQVIDAVSQHLGIEQEQKLLSVCMMVRNEAHQIGIALNSILEAADEIVIADTGSTDNTVDVIKKVVPPEKLVLFNYDAGTPIRSFSEARNAAFDKATCKYVMWFDAGDRLANAQALRAYVEAQRSDMARFVTVYGDSRFWRERVVLRVFAQFKDRVHETMDIYDLADEHVDIEIHHVWTPKVGRENSLERNVRLLKQMIEEEPEHERRARWVFYLARDLQQLGKLDESMEYYTERLSLDGFIEEKMQAAIAIARIHLDGKRYLDAIRAAYEALKVCDGLREPYYVVGDAYFWMGTYDRAAAWFKHCIAVPRPDVDLWLWEDVYTWLPLCQLSHCYKNLGNKTEAMYWAQQERQVAPSSQHSRISSMMATLK
jgi:ADP-heptose:LPS heptosyltransferase/glycosyltransferase involved in cell wall biosynthesis